MTDLYRAGSTHTAMSPGLHTTGESARPEKAPDMYLESAWSGNGIHLLGASCFQYLRDCRRVDIVPCLCTQGL